MSSHNIPDLSSISSTLSGLVPNKIIIIVTDLLSTKISKTLITKFLLHLNQQIYYKIWIPYCILRFTIHPPTSNLSFNSTSQLVQTPSLNTISSKINSWYIQWIKYQTNLSYIITNTQI